MEHRLSEFDIVSGAFQADPFPTFARMRTHGGSLVRMKLPLFGKTWIAVSHEACTALLKDGDLFVRDPGNAGIRTQARILRFLPRTLSLLALNMLGQDDPEHRRLRGLVDQAFQRRNIESFRPMIAQEADRLLDRMEGSVEVDLMEAYCRDLPLSVISRLLGVPERDHETFKSWLGGLKDTANVWAVVRAIPGVIRVVRYLRRLSRADGGAAPDGLIAALRGAEIDGRTLTEDELVSMIFLLFGAGQETTTHLIGGGLLELLSDDRQRRELQADPSLLPACVEECLRHVSPVQLSKPRWAARDTLFFGYRIRKGEGVAAMLASANSDPEKFDEPHRFQIGRRPNPHLSFGTGVHFCLGFQLARAEMAVALERFLARFPRAALAVPRAEVVWRGRLGIRALSALPASLGPRSPRTLA